MTECCLTCTFVNKHLTNIGISGTPSESDRHALVGMPTGYDLEPLSDDLLQLPHPQHGAELAQQQQHLTYQPQPGSFSAGIAAMLV